MTLFDEPERAPQPDAEVPARPRARLRMLVAYDGTAYHGFAANRDVATVQGTLEQALQTVLREPVVLTGAGRTDKGVHAWGQVVSFDASAPVASLGDLRHSLNKLCRGSIVVRDIEAVADDFDARFSATSRVYRYDVLNEPVPDPFAARTAWLVDQPLDLRAMQLAGDPLIGEHDFSSFCRRPKGGDDEPSMSRRVLDARWSTPAHARGRLLRFEIEARAFCHQMVRSIVGTMVEVGSGRKRAGEMAGILRARDRSAAGQLAPPHGLCLWEVRYGPSGKSGEPTG
jgi:tRNA pseudouridine38-40 synthase